MNTIGGAENVHGILRELQMNVARKKNDLASLEDKIKECQISLNQLIQPKLQKLVEEKEEKERQFTELESLLVSKEKCRLEIMDAHSSDLHRLKSMGKSLETFEEKILDKKLEGVENSRFFFSLFPPPSPNQAKMSFFKANFFNRLWIEKSRNGAELMMKLKMSGVNGNQDIFEKVHSSFEEKEKILEELKLRLKKSQAMAVSMEAKNREIEFAMADKSLNEIEQSLAREQMRSMDLDEKDERLAIRQRLAIRKK